MPTQLLDLIMYANTTSYKHKSLQHIIIITGYIHMALEYSTAPDVSALTKTSSKKENIIVHGRTTVNVEKLYHRNSIVHFSATWHIIT